VLIAREVRRGQEDLGQVRKLTGYAYRPAVERGAFSGCEHPSGRLVGRSRKGELINHPEAVVYAAIFPEVQSGQPGIERPGLHEGGNHPAVELMELDAVCLAAKPGAVGGPKWIARGGQMQAETIPERAVGNGESQFLGHDEVSHFL
jgi:hypothetical protein